MPGPDPRSAAISQMITEVYHEQGPAPIMAYFGLSKSAVYARAFKLGIMASEWRHGSGTLDPRRKEIDTMIREVYPTQGYKPIAERFGLTRNTVYIHAQLLGVYRDYSAESIRNKEILEMIREVYPIQGVGPICEKYGLTPIAVGLRARRAGIHQDTEALYERISETRTRLYDTLDLSLWTPQLTKVGAYYLGLAWADATTAFVRPADAVGRWSRYHVAFAQSGEEDAEVVYYLARKLSLPDSRVRKVKKYKDSHKHPYRLKLSGKRIASLFIDHFGIPMRKSFIDPPYPNIPDRVIFSFARGLFDGDGSSTYSWDGGYCAPSVYFFGSHLFLREFRERLQSQLSYPVPVVRPHIESLDVFGIYEREAVAELVWAMHSESEDGGDYPYMKRKHCHLMRFAGILD